ncbi:MAG: T9SS type A sorting domain-containing protein [Janthinobacterium lividum]
MKQLLRIALALAPLTGFAQGLTNNGTTITVGAGATLYVAGGVLNQAGSTLVNAGTTQLTGDLTNAGTLNSGGLLLFSGSANQTFAPGTAPTVARLTFDNARASGQNTLSISADLTVGTALTLLNGLVRLAPSATLTLPEGATLTGEAPGRYVQGQVRAVRNAVSGSTAVAFPNSATLNPNGQNLGTVTITRTAGLQTAGVSYGTNLAGTTQGIDRIWTVAATGTQPTAATPVTVALSWLADDDNGFAPGATSQFWRAASAAGPWAKMGAPGSAAGRSFAADITELGALTISNSAVPLPVELTRFTAEPLGEDALVRWATASEKNNDHFEVEASADGQVFNHIGQVAGQGSTTQPHEYQFTDKNISHYAAEPVYYRLRQVDADGTATYSPVRAVWVSGSAEFMAQLYPNPSHSSEVPTVLVRTRAPGSVRWELADPLGRTLLRQAVEVPVGTTPLSLTVASALRSGVYLLKIQQGQQVRTLKLVRE